MKPHSKFYQFVEDAVDNYGGLFNSHLHLDRAGTLDRKYLGHMGMNPIEASSYSLRTKQNLTGDLHRGLAYEEEDLRIRIEDYLNQLIELGTVRADSFIDVSSTDIGLRALDVALDLKDEKKNEIDFRIGAYPVFGFKDDEPERWDLYIAAVDKADYLGCLPERDDKNYHPHHIGYTESVKRTLELAKEVGKPIQYHVDQANDPREKGTETLVEAVKWLGTPEIKEEGPSVWAVHAISPSTYPEERFQKLLAGLYEQKIGVISCPTAAVSMRQLRPLETPTYNSIARVLEMLVKEIPVRIGSDNIADVFLPSTTPSLYDEILMLSNAVRFYNPDILAKIACGKELTDMDRELIRRSLEQDEEVFNGMKKEY